MRELPILGSQGEIDEHVVGIIQACMMYPDDQASINDDIDLYRLRASKGFPDTAFGRLMTEQWRSAATSGGLRTGTILYKIAVFRSRPELGRVGHNKAIYMVSSEVRGAGPPTEKRQSTFKSDWKIYKNAAHLWAAFAIVFAGNGSQLPLDFIRLIQIAERLRELAEPAIDDWDPWRMPASLDRGPDFDPGGPDADDLRLLKNYRA